MTYGHMSVLAGKRVFVTGHTGFTGSWVSIWLSSLGAEVFGYSLEPETNPNLFSEAKIQDLINGQTGDIRDFQKLSERMSSFQPDLVLHLAAQPLVRRGYRIPRETFEINTQGTANVLEAARNTSSVQGVLCITTDKVYKNLEIDYRYLESDELGGNDPYSASKAAAELIIESYRFSRKSSKTKYPILAVARGGNIVGGGDWSEDRIVPDYIRALESSTPLEIRFPQATRPWQHVLSLVDGYLTILAGMVGVEAEKFDRAFNLGPMDAESISVSELLSLLSRKLPGVSIQEHASEFHEAGKLALDSSLASKTFGWSPNWDTATAIEKTADWYREFRENNRPAYQLCLDQIDSWKESKKEPRVS